MNIGQISKLFHYGLRLIDLPLFVFYDCQPRPSFIKRVRIVSVSFRVVQIDQFDFDITGDRKCYVDRLQDTTFYMRGYRIQTAAFSVCVAADVFCLFHLNTPIRVFYMKNGAL